MKRYLVYFNNNGFRLYSLIKGLLQLIHFNYISLLYFILQFLMRYVHTNLTIPFLRVALKCYYFEQKKRGTILAKNTAGSFKISKNVPRFLPIYLLLFIVLALFCIRFLHCIPYHLSVKNPTSFLSYFFTLNSFL